MVANKAYPYLKNFLMVCLMVLSVLLVMKFENKNFSIDIGYILAQEANGFTAIDGSYVANSPAEFMVTMRAQNALVRQGLHNDDIRGPQEYAAWKAAHGGVSAIYFYNTDEQLVKAGLPTKAQALAMAKGTAVPATTTATVSNTNAQQIAALQANLVSLAQQYQDAMARGDLAYAQKCVDLTNVINSQILALQIQ